MQKFFALLLTLSCAFAVAADRPGPSWVLENSGAPWQPRDSQGEVVYGGKLWIFGGWFNSFEAPPRDVWSSADGKSWERVAADAPWPHSDLPMSVTFRDRMWMMGGWYNGRLPGHSASNTVWSSKDGKTWQKEVQNAAFSPRLAAAIVTFRGKMWLLGGTENYYFGDRKSLKNDVWSSSDGKNWTLATPDAGWAPRAYHQAVVHDGRIWVMGGGNYVPEYQAFNDVWSSADGVHWRQETPADPSNPRLWSSAVTYRGHIWVLGGWSKVPETNWGDVWYSKNGRDWTRLTAETLWKERHEHSAFVHRDRIWIAGGHAKPLSNEVWSLYLPPDFFPKK